MSPQTKTRQRAKVRPAEPNDRQQAFIREFAICADLEEAQRRAGYVPHHGNARRILNDPRSANLLERHKRKAAELAEIQLAWTLANLKKIANGNVWDILAKNDDGALDVDAAGKPRIDCSRLTPEQAYAIEAIGFDSKGRLKIGFHDKVAANRVILEHLTPEKPQRLRLEGPTGGPVEVVPGLADRLRAARERRRATGA